MSQYVTDSKAFLQHYHTLSVYVAGLDKLTSQLTDYVASIAKLQSSKSAAEVTQNIGDAQAQLFSVIEDFGNLKPPKDLEEFHSATLKAFYLVHDDYMDLSDAINERDGAKMTAIAPKADQDFAALEPIFNYDFAGHIQKNSTLRSQIDKLQSENPLTN